MTDNGESEPLWTGDDWEPKPGQRVLVDAADLLFVLKNARPPERVPQYVHLAAARLRSDLNAQPGGHSGRDDHE